MFTLNRVTGKPIFDIEERPVPKSNLPGEQASPTQPFPVKPPPLTQNSVWRDDTKGKPQHQSLCEHMVDDNNMKLGGPFMPIAFGEKIPGVSVHPARGRRRLLGAPRPDPKLHLFHDEYNESICPPMRLNPSHGRGINNS